MAKALQPRGKRQPQNDDLFLKPATGAENPQTLQGIMM